MAATIGSISGCASSRQSPSGTTDSSTTSMVGSVYQTTPNNASPATTGSTQRGFESDSVITADHSDQNTD
jgi:hypothetical protein